MLLAERTNRHRRARPTAGGSLHAAAFHSAVCSHPGRIVQLKKVGVEPCDALMLAGSTLEDAEAAKNAGVDSLDLRQLSMGAKASDCVNPFGNDPTLAGAGYAGSVSNRRLTPQWGRGWHCAAGAARQNVVQSFAVPGSRHQGTRF